MRRLSDEKVLPEEPLVVSVEQRDLLSKVRGGDELPDVLGPQHRHRGAAQEAEARHSFGRGGPEADLVVAGSASGRPQRWRLLGRRFQSARAATAAAKEVASSTLTVSVEGMGWVWGPIWLEQKLNLIEKKYSITRKRFKSKKLLLSVCVGV